MKSFKSIPGPRSFPLVGTLYQYLPLIGSYKFNKIHLNGFKKLKKFGPIVREEIVPNVNIVWLFKPEDYEVMFRNEGKYPQRRSHLALEKYRLDRPNIYNTGGLLPTNGPEWSRLRKVFQNGLINPKSALNYVECSDEVIQEWISSIQTKTNIDYMPQLSRLFLELTGVSLFDLKFGSFSQEELQSNSRTSKLINAAFVINSSVVKTDSGPQLWRKFDTPLYRRMRKSLEFMESVTLDVVSQKMQILAKKGFTNPASLLESYLMSPELDEKDIAGIVSDFLLAGIDTTTYTTSFLLYHLANDSRVQQKLYEETLKLLPNPSSRITPEIINGANYAKAVLKELLRLRPISVGIGRVLTKTCVFSGYEVPEGVVAVTQSQITCRLNEYFPNANEFIPERWLKESPNYKKPHPFLVLPFGFGPRSCIARRLAEQHMLILLLKISRNFVLEWKGSVLDVNTLLINVPDGPILLDFKRR